MTSVSPLVCVAFRVDGVRYTSLVDKRTAAPDPDPDPEGEGEGAELDELPEGVTMLLGLVA
jgi:hypothetical protein